jgi:hypothetical protein
LGNACRLKGHKRVPCPPAITVAKTGLDGLINSW